MIQSTNNDELNIKQTKVRGYYKHSRSGRSVWVSPHYRVIMKHQSDTVPALKRKFLIKIPRSH